MKTYPYSFQRALDGNDINGLEGMAGICNFLFDPSDNSYAFKIKYFNGMAEVMRLYKPRWKICVDIKNFLIFQ